MWSPKGHVGHYAEVWTGENKEHYAIFPIPDVMASVEDIRGTIPEARVILVHRRGAMGVSSRVDYWFSR